MKFNRGRLFGLFVGAVAMTAFFLYRHHFSPPVVLLSGDRTEVGVTSAVSSNEAAIEPSVAPIPPGVSLPGTQALSPSAMAQTPAATPPPRAAAAPASAAADVLAGIPPGHFRTGLMRLEPTARERALAKLVRLQAPKEDYASLHVSPAGDLYYACALHPVTTVASFPHAHPVHAQAAAAATSPTPVTANAATVPQVQAAPVSINSPPIRHSRPGATRVLYLDFNGHTITGTQWNISREVTTYAARPYDTDGAPNSFSDAEQAAIIQIWERVAEDFAPFEIDVTTEEPATFTPTTGRALITPSTDDNGLDMPRSTSAGVAYSFVFGEPDYVERYSPALIYARSGYSAADLADTISHEFGHNLGLSHDGQTTGVEYYGGHGSGPTSWGPIMGTSYNHAVSQWSKGEYYLANNTQDDLALIAALIPYRTDVAGSTFATASTPPILGNALSTRGILTTATKTDVYVFSTLAGPLTFSATAYRATSGSRGNNADLNLELLNSSGNVVASANPADSPDATLNYQAAAGTYYLRLNSSGTGSPLIFYPSGYTSYGSVGQYTLNGTIINSPPVITSELTVSAPAGGAFTYTITGSNTPTRFRTTALPPGLALEPASGVISGRPSVVGTFTISLMASNERGPGDATLVLTFFDAPPSIVSQTSGAQWLTPGGSATLAVNVFSPSGPVTYQWKRNGLPLAGATDATYVIKTASTLDSGYYQVMATNTLGTVTSAVQFVRVVPASTTVVAWGNNTFGAAPPAEHKRIAKISSTDFYALGLKADGTVTGWGYSNYGQIYAPAGLTQVVDVVAGDLSALALLADGTVKSWGLNDGLPTAGLGEVAAIAMGSSPFALQSNGTLVSWGYDYGNFINRVPTGLTGIVAIASKSNHALALKNDGTVVAWGNNTHLQATVPDGLANVVAIAAGFDHSLALKVDGTVVGWGKGFNNAPSAALTGVRALDAGIQHGLALKSDGTVIAWGDNSWGQTKVPTGLSSVFAIAAGGNRSYALSGSGTGTGTSPLISSHPATQAVAAGASVSFTVAASGGTSPVTYQWRRNTVALAGQTSANLVLPSVAVADTGNYDVVVKNEFGSVMAIPATLTVAPKPLTPQVLNFAPLGSMTYADAPIALTATASSGLAPLFTVLSGPATLNGNTLTLTGVGTVVVRAVQFGNDTYEAAPVIDRTLVVLSAAPLTFKAADYLARYPDLQRAFGGGADPGGRAWQHYLTAGIAEGRSGGDGFSPAAYLAAQADLRAAFGQDLGAAARHWYNHGRYEGRGIPPGFSATGYLHRNTDVAGAYGQDLWGAYQHWLSSGLNEGRTYDDRLKVREYLELNLDVKAAFGGNLRAAFEHWVNFGLPEGREGRIPAAFAVAGYLSRNGDLQKAFGADASNAVTAVKAYQHFLGWGAQEGRFFNDSFRAQEYLLLHRDLVAAFKQDVGAAARHYLRFGQAEGRLGRVPVAFTVAGYLSKHPDLKAAFGGDASSAATVVRSYEHYLDYGLKEGRAFDERFRPLEYLDLHADLRAAFKQDLLAAALHWFMYGAAEGRQGRK